MFAKVYVSDAHGFLDVLDFFFGCKDSYPVSLSEDEDMKTENTFL